MIAEIIDRKPRVLTKEMLEAIELIFSVDEKIELKESDIKEAQERVKQKKAEKELLQEQQSKATAALRELLYPSKRENLPLFDQVPKGAIDLEAGSKRESALNLYRFNAVSKEEMEKSLEDTTVDVGQISKGGETLGIRIYDLEALIKFSEEKSLGENVEAALREIEGYNQEKLKEVWERAKYEIGVESVFELEPRAEGEGEEKLFALIKLKEGEEVNELPIYETEIGKYFGDGVEGDELTKKIGSMSKDELKTLYIAVADYYNDKLQSQPQEETVSEVGANELTLSNIKLFFKQADKAEESEESNLRAEIQADGTGIISNGYLRKKVLPRRVSQISKGGLYTKNKVLIEGDLRELSQEDLYELWSSEWARPYGERNIKDGEKLHFYPLENGDWIGEVGKDYKTVSKEKVEAVKKGVRMASGNFIGGNLNAVTEEEKEELFNSDELCRESTEAEIEECLQIKRTRSINQGLTPIEKGNELNRKRKKKGQM